MSQFSFKKLVKAAIKRESFQYLNSLKGGHSKVSHIQYDQLKMQDYFTTNQLSTQMKKFTFLCRSRMLAVGANYKAGNQKPTCPICKIAYDSQCHLLVCEKLLENTICDNLPKYEDLFSQNLERKIAVVRILNENFKTREKILKLDNN